MFGARVYEERFSATFPLQPDGLSDPDEVTQDYTMISQRTRECAGEQLHNAFKRAYFDVLRTPGNFTIVWNELADRSTTKPNDVPFIIANIVGLSTLRLLQIQETEDMYQDIFLSMHKLHLSILFNQGLAKTGNHRNRWLPREVGAEIVTGPQKF